MTGFAEILSQDRRRAILCLLNEAPDYAANDSVLHAAMQEIGHHCSRDAVRTELSWLKEQGLVTTEEMLGGKVLVATLTERGGDVQAGRATVPGVKRPSPR